MEVDITPTMPFCPVRLLAVARRHLSREELAAFTEAIEAGYRPIGAER
jgi:hypothetical protein